MDQELHGGLESLLASLETFNRWNDTKRWQSPSSLLDAHECSKLFNSAEIALSQTLYGVRATINTLTMINRLPTDVLKSVFDWLSPPPIENFLPAFKGQRSRQPSPQLNLQHWLYVAAVCRHWREVAVSSMSCWSTVAIGPNSVPGSVIQMQIRYSGSACIDFHACAELSQSERTCDCVPYFDWDSFDLQPLIPRLRSFHLHPPISAPDVRRILEQLTIPALHLEHLTLSSLSHARNRRGPAFVCIGTRKLPKVFQDETPRLKSLTIAQFTSWPENNFRNLTRLCLKHQQSALWHGSDSESTEWMTRRSSFIQILANSPGLEELVLVDTTEFINDSDITLDLLHLQMLVVTEWDHNSIASFFYALKFPTSCAVYLQPMPSAGEALKGMMELSCLQKMRGFLQSITRLYLRFVQSVSRPSPLHHLIACGAGGLYLDTKEWEGFRGSALPLSPAYAALYSSMNLEELWLDVTRNLESMNLLQWHQLYDTMPDVTKLVLFLRYDSDERPPLTCLDALGERAEGLCLPNLSELHLINCYNLSAEGLPTLQRIQVQRDALGAPIRKLVVGAEPPLELYEEDIQEVQEKLGAGVVCGIQELSFNWSPFRDRIPYQQHWPEELYGCLPGLWSTH